MPSKPKNKEESGLECPHCKVSLTVAEVLDASDVCWSNQRWIAFDCPKCKESSHAHLTSKMLEIGELDGAPGPCFFMSSKCALRGVSVAWSAGGVTVKYAGKSKRIVSR